MTYTSTINELSLNAHRNVGAAMARLPGAALAVTMAGSRYQRAVIDCNDEAQRVYWKAYESAEEVLVTGHSR